jgi:ABC-2 type transport system ATP-binding protein
MSVAINVTGLVKDFGDVHAVRGIDFAVDEGEMFGFLGPNGAGKSTTIKILCTLADPTAGSATVAGHDVIRERSLVRRSIGLVFQEPTLDLYLTGRQNLSFHGELYGVPKAVLRRRIGDVLEMVGLSDRRDDKVQTYSGGMKRRLEIGRGLLHSPRVLFLDEPTIGLDPQTRASIWEYVALLREAEDITVFTTTHYMDEAEHCDRIAIMNEGQLAVIDSPDALKSSIGKDRVQFRTDDDERAITDVREKFGLEAAMHNGALTVQVAGGAEFVPRLFAALSVPITTVTVTRPSLDDVFMTYTGTTISDAERPKAGLR